MRMSVENESFRKAWRFLWLPTTLPNLDGVKEKRWLEWAEILYFKDPGDFAAMGGWVKWKWLD